MTQQFLRRGNPQGATPERRPRRRSKRRPATSPPFSTTRFRAIVMPPHVSQHASSTGMVTWNWDGDFTASSDNGALSRHSTIQRSPPIEYRDLRGARSLSGNTAGVGGPGGYRLEQRHPERQLHASRDQSNQRHHRRLFEPGRQLAASRAASPAGVERSRSTTMDRPPGISITRRRRPETSTDFYSVAIHELAHALGFGS